MPEHRVSEREDDDDRHDPRRIASPINWVQAATTLACLGVVAMFGFQWNLGTRLTAIEVRNSNRDSVIPSERAELHELQATVDRNSNRITTAEGIDANRDKEMAGVHAEIARIGAGSEACNNTMAGVTSTLRYLEDALHQVQDEFQDRERQRRDSIGDYTVPPPTTRVPAKR